MKIKAKTVRRFGMVLGCLIAILAYLAIAAVSWIVTCGLIYLITLCFGWTFSWAWATGIWLVMFLLRSVFSSSSSSKK